MVRPSFSLTEEALGDSGSAVFDPKPQAPQLMQLAGNIPTGEPKALAESSYAKAERDLSNKRIESLKRKDIYEDTKSAAAKGEAAAKEAREAAVYAQYKPQLTAPYETFKPTGDTASSLASLGLMIGMLGAMGGKKGLTSATGAMNSIAGMMTGYQEGSKEKYERERKNFEENVKIAQQNHALIEKEFERAVKYAKYDLTGATNAMIKSSLARGDSTTANRIKEVGVVQTGSEVFDAGRKINGRVNIAKNEMRNAEYEVLKAEGETKALAAQRLQEKEAQDTELKKYTIQKAQREATEGTVAERAAKDTADFIVRNKQLPKTGAEMAAVQKYYPEYQVTRPEYRVGGFVAQALGEDAIKGFTGSEGAKALSKISDATDGINRAERVQKLAQDPAIKYGVVATYTQKLEQQIRANMQSFSSDESVAREEIRQIINSIPIDPNDKNAVFAKESAFVALAIERGERGGTVLPVGFIKALGPLLDPKQFTKESYLSILEGRKEDLMESLTAFGFGENEIKKLTDQRKKLSGRESRESQPITESPPEKMFKGRVITVRDGKWVYKDSGEEAK